eukprot:TRINITY_DN3375_c0_g1_i1.p1 TRINITY_DN3375_c0_g1~~TRINITY_DN3375_c0_g1_i1.p1  ORF type:complete len:1803 (-),score=416.56 TRINITY_DN3375_c0_g1_i1:187-5595(-)
MSHARAGAVGGSSTVLGGAHAADSGSKDAETWLHLDQDELGCRLLRLAMKVMLTENLEVNQPLMDAGMDSIESVDFRNQLERRLPGIKLPGALILEYPTIRDLREFILRAISAYHAQKGAMDASATTPLLDAVLQAPDGTVTLPRDFPAPARHRRHSSAVLLTGATGFLGVNLLCELLASAAGACSDEADGAGAVAGAGGSEAAPGAAAAAAGAVRRGGSLVARVYVLIRAATVEVGWKRLLEAFKSHCLELQPRDLARLEVLPTEDLSLPMLGLSAEDYNRLVCAGLSTIIHNAAAVNWFKRYEQLRSTNVETTLVLLRLAAELGAKFGYVSSISTLPLAQPELALNEACENSWRCNTVLKMSGYSQTKWMSEQLCFAAARHGVPVSVFRMPFIVGHTRSGCMNLQDTPARMIAAIVELQEAPVTVQLDCIAVDVVARVTVRVSLRPETCGVSAATGELVDGDAGQCVVHIAARFGKMGIEKVFEQLRRSGFSGIKWVSRNDWVHRAMERQTAAAPIQVFDRLFNRPALVNTMRAEVLRELDVPEEDIQEVSQRHLEAMIRYLRSRKALPAAAEEAPNLPGVRGSPVARAGKQRTESADSADARAPLDPEACRRQCNEDMPGYHAAVAAQNLHWFHSDAEAWLTWRPATKVKDGSRPATTGAGAFAPGQGTWRGFNALPAVAPGTPQDVAEAATARAAKPTSLPAEEAWQPWTCVFDDSAEPFYKWFVGGRTNACLNEVDRHLAKGHGDEVAHIVDLVRTTASSGPSEQQITRRRLLEETAITAKVLQLPPLSLSLGDRVLLVLPTNVEQLVWTEACKRLGVIYSSCAPGMVASVLAERIAELQPKVVITMQNVWSWRWVSSVASALNDFVRTSWFLQAVQVAIGNFGAPRMRSSLLERTMRGGADTRAFSAALAEAHVVLQDIFGASRCVNLSTALAQLIREVTTRVRGHPAEHLSDDIRERLAALEDSVHAFCAERAAGCTVNVLLVDEEAPGDVGRSAGERAGGGTELERLRFGQAACFSSAALRAAAEESIISARAASSKAGGVGGGRGLHGAGEEAADDVEILARSWREATEAVPVDANFPLFVCYTSGSTARPSGIVHCHGYVAGIAETLRWGFGAVPGKDRLMAMSHPGWIVGQSYMYSAPLCARITSVAIEGSPVRPTQLRFAEVIARHKVSILKTGSTFLRELMCCPKVIRSLRQDFDLSCLRVLTFCGEPLPPQVQAFAMQNLCSEPINSYWSTEHGGIVWTRAFGCRDQLLVANAHTWPLPWVKARVLSIGDECSAPWGDDRRLAAEYPELVGMEDDRFDKPMIARPARMGESGDVAVLEPFPYLFRCVWGDAERVLQKGWRGDVDAYLSRYWHRVAIGGDAPRWCFIQRDWALEHPGGAFTFHGRSDEVMNLCGMILSTETLETAIQRDKHLNGSLSPVLDCAVVGHPHKIYGEMPLAFVTPAAQGVRMSDGDVERLSSLVYEAVGNVGVQFIMVPELPRTQTGKIMRKVLHALLRDDRPAFMQAAKSVRNLACLRAIQGELQEWRRMHSNFGTSPMLPPPQFPRSGSSRRFDSSDSGGSDDFMDWQQPAQQLSVPLQQPPQQQQNLQQAPQALGFPRSPGLPQAQGLDRELRRSASGGGGGGGGHLRGGGVRSSSSNAGGIARIGSSSNFSGLRRNSSLGSVSQQTPPPYPQDARTYSGNLSNWSVGDDRGDQNQGWDAAPKTCFLQVPTPQPRGVGQNGSGAAGPGQQADAPASARRKRRNPAAGEGVVDHPASAWEITLDLRQVLAFAAGVGAALAITMISSSRRR